MGPNKRYWPQKLEYDTAAVTILTKVPPEHHRRSGDAQCKNQSTKNKQVAMKTSPYLCQKLHLVCVWGGGGRTYNGLLFLSLLGIGMFSILLADKISLR